MPTASVTAIPGANDSVILTGTVNLAEDVDVIMKAAVGVVSGPDRVINRMRVGGVQQVQHPGNRARTGRARVKLSLRPQFSAEYDTSTPARAPV